MGSLSKLAQAKRKRSQQNQKSDISKMFAIAASIATTVDRGEQAAKEKKKRTMWK